MAKGSSSTKKAAQLAQQRSGARTGSRFQGGVFPLALVLVIAIGVGLVVYSRESRPDPQAGAPTIQEHWHAVYGINVCGTWYQPVGRPEVDDDQTANTPFELTGIHSHDDGVIHWHANSGRATGDNATLGVYHDVYGIDLSNDALKIGEDTLLISSPEPSDDDAGAGDGEATGGADGGENDDAATDPTWPGAGDGAGDGEDGAATGTTIAETTVPADGTDVDAEEELGEFLEGPQEWVEDEYTCEGGEYDGEKVKISLVRWDYFEDTRPAAELTASLNDVRIDTDGMVLGLYLLPEGADREMPHWAKDLPTLASRLNPTEDYQAGQIGGEYEVTSITTVPTSDGAESDDTTGSDPEGDDEDAPGESGGANGSNDGPEVTATENSEG